MQGRHATALLARRHVVHFERNTDKDTDIATLIESALNDGLGASLAHSKSNYGLCIP